MMLHGLNLEKRSLRGWYCLTVLCLVVSLVTCTFPSLGGSGAGSSGQVWAQEEGEEATEEPAEEPAASSSSDSKDAAADEEKPEQSFLSWLNEASGICGYGIGIESFLLIAFVLTNYMSLRRDNFVPPAFVESFEQKLQARDYQGAYELAKKDESFLARVLAGGLSRLSRGYEEAVAAMQEVGEDENMTLDHKLSYIQMIGTTAPMLGLLGTVQGMISAFSVIAQSATSPKPSELATGITMALVTTFEGLIVAIPAIIFYGLLKNKQARLVLEVGMVGEGLMSRLAQAGKRPAAPGTATAPAAPAAPVN